MNIQQASAEELDIHRSPDKVDQAVQLVRPRQKMFISFIFAIIVATIIWSIVSSVPVYVKGKGILINESGISEIKVPFPGKISQLNVKIGQQVEQGEILATVEQLELIFDIKKLETQIRDIRKSLNWLLDNTDLAVRNKSIQQLKATIAGYDRQLRSLNSEAENYEQEKAGLEKDRQTELLRMTDLVNYNHARIFEFRNNLRTYESELQFKKNQLVNQSQIVSPYSGTVIDMAFNNGDIFNEGSTFLVMENQDYDRNELIAQVYVNANEGKKLQPGMTVQIAPSTIPPEEHGYLLGTVSYISKYTLTEAGMNRTLRNSKLVEELSRDGLPMVAEVRLSTDSSTFSKYKWTSGRGPETDVMSGTLIRANIIAEERSPISFIFPSLKHSR
ncbi:NHLP bacteriocin system secretion protein [Pseudobacter ginsenosidimutans]|uniref:NHLM bacteriocin system secretion protein n=1 Tax=Pseudobacter ginsenosidimutans TaxID=661488 RepID=A0A4V2F1N9_9BACT|nr:NHLP bacteriocin system secretion protein [Pseudobacter ginsenosidimutans]QEC43081.1 NHLP bacteriocin system secretion protein [Pseudobacter ginsenosidimutans]RZS74436.1 NHLM bacteriocin system secretion protein [Pseudobacter ginsenosidimutans]